MDRVRRASPVLMGRAYDATGSYSSLLLILAALALFAAALALTLPAYARWDSENRPSHGTGA
ncbi:MAG: hypothetical protein RMK57_01760 [Bryobacterales bacterium]|nr:hypothetical protein [Bryobacteraceae bacterium]MDW8353231.1 hypothetical protein [Bryobacterales bacterium]